MEDADIGASTGTTVKAGKAAIAGLQTTEVRSRYADLLDWMLPASWKADPSSVDKDERQVYLIRFVVSLVGAICHASLVPLYLLLDSANLAMANVLSVMVFLTGMMLMKSGRHYLGIIIVFAEALVHVPVMLWLLGLESGCAGSILITGSRP